METDFSDIINKERPEHKNDDFARRHPKMQRQDRAKIFAPYAALSGHFERAKKCERITAPKTELSDDAAEKLNAKLNEISEQLKQKRRVKAKITFFIPDEDRRGEGEYTSTEVSVKKIDPVSGEITAEGYKIDISDIYDIELCQNFDCISKNNDKS